jgi:hypothetical protein
VKIPANFYVVTEWTPLTTDKARKEVNTPERTAGRRAASATLQRPFYPAIPQQSRSYLLAYFYSATLAWF